MAHLGIFPWRSSILMSELLTLDHRFFTFEVWKLHIRIFGSEKKTLGLCWVVWEMH